MSESSCCLADCPGRTSAPRTAVYPRVMSRIACAAGAAVNERRSLQAAATATAETAAPSLLPALGLARAVAAIVRGVCDSQGLVHALVIGSILACMPMLAVGDSGTSPRWSFEIS